MLSEMIVSKINKNQKRFDPILESVLFCGTFELFSYPETDKAIIISDYIHVTEAFFEGSEPKLINGLLDNLAQDIRD